MFTCTMQTESVRPENNETIIRYIERAVQDNQQEQLLSLSGDDAQIALDMMWNVSTPAHVIIGWTDFC